MGSTAAAGPPTAVNQCTALLVLVMTSNMMHAAPRYAEATKKVTTNQAADTPRS
jgi:hypothetical protein